LEWPVAVERFQTGFPDCVLRRLDTGETMRVEFELLSSHFLAHGHSADECDLIICWRKDRALDGVEVLELRPIVETKRPDLLQHSAEVSEPSEVAFLADAEMHGATEVTLGLLRRLINQSRERGLEPEFLPGPEVVVSVGVGAQFFKVYSPDILALPLVRLDAGRHFGELARRLNAACPGLKLGSEDERTKGKGGQLSKLFDGANAVDKFVDAWAWFRIQRDA
jgi:hypothetical protein